MTYAADMMAGWTEDTPLIHAQSNNTSFAIVSLDLSLHVCGLSPIPAEKVGAYGVQEMWQRCWDGGKTKWHMPQINV